MIAQKVHFLVALVDMKEIARLHNHLGELLARQVDATDPEWWDEYDDIVDGLQRIKKE